MPSKRLLALTPMLAALTATFLVIAFISVIERVRAAANDSVSVVASAQLAVPSSGEENSPIELFKSVDLPCVYAGPTDLADALSQGTAEPLALASGDFDEDGVEDLACGYASQGAGIMTLHRGNVESIYPRQGTVKTTDNNSRHLPFLSEAEALKLPEAPSFLGTGDFDADGHCDVVTAARGTNVLYLLSGDGHGAFGPAHPIDLPGAITTFVTGEINRADGLADLVVGVITPGGAAILVFDSPEGALKACAENGRNPRALETSGIMLRELPFAAAPTALALGQLDESYEWDLAVASGNEVLIVSGRDQTISDLRAEPVRIDRYSFPFSISSIVLGNFISDKRHRTEIAVLCEDGLVRVMGRRDRRVRRANDREWLTENREGLDLLNAASRDFALVSAKVSASPTDDLIVVDNANRGIYLLRDGSKAAKVLSIASPQDPPIAVAPMRLNADALRDLVVLRRRGPAALLIAPQAVFTVTNTNNAGAGSLRQAIIDANVGIGADLITFDIPGAGPHTIRPTSPLPPISNPATIDGTTEPNFAGTPVVELDGSLAGDTYCLYIWAGNSMVRGLAINRFARDGIQLTTNGGNIVEGNFIGTDIPGTHARGNSGNGISVIDSPGNLIGGTATAARNLISGNSIRGIYIGGTRSTLNDIRGNFIGTDVTGAADLGNSNNGVEINRSPANRIGANVSGAGNIISGNNNDGVTIIDANATGNLVQRNYIGADVSGARDLSNSFNGVVVFNAPSNTIGGTTSSVRNIISGNNQSGVQITGDDSARNLVQGNYIGTDLSGAADLGNSSEGILIGVDSTDNTIGGVTNTPGTAGGNVISGNGGHGVDIRDDGSTRNVVRGNLIGTNRTGLASLGNSGDGIRIRNSASGNTIGGTGGKARNVISGNLGAGVSIIGSNTNGNMVEGNYIGTNINGTSDLGNSLEGVLIANAASNTIGPGNTISGNRTGVLIQYIGSQWNLVQDNFIGTDATGNAGTGNSLAGVRVESDAGNNTIGGADSSDGNIIAFNGGDGVEIFSGSGNAILSNSIFSNDGLGIDLGANGPSANDNDDVDSGANSLQNAPVITSFSSNTFIGTTTVDGTLNSTPNTEFTLQFFAGTGCDFEGKTFIGSRNVTTDAAGDAGFRFAFNFTFSLAAPVPRVITATATNPTNNTSEFSSAGPFAECLPDLRQEAEGSRQKTIYHLSLVICHLSLQEPRLIRWGSSMTNDK